MGTDIHMVAERRINGKWELFTEDVFNDVYEEESKSFVPYDGRNYNLFAILADVRNGRGFAGCKIGEKFNPISEPKGYPTDMDESSWSAMSEDHSASWLTLKEIDDYDWEQMHRDYGIVSEEEYKKSLMLGKNPFDWCGGIHGQNIVVLKEGEMQDLVNGSYPRDDTKNYYVECYFNPETYRKSAEFFLENMEILRKHIPEGGTTEDVRIVFDFDS